MQSRTRRELLATLGVAGGALAAGCLGGPAEEDDETDERESTDGEPSAGPLVSGEFAGECPQYVSAERVICWDAVDEKSVPGYLEPSARTLAPDESVEFTLVNRGAAALETNLYNWQLHKRVDGVWFHVAPLSWPRPTMAVEPDETHTWTVTVEDAGVEDGQPVPRLRTTGDVALAGVGGGRYAFRARGRFADDDFETAIAFAATVDLDAEPLRLTPTDAVQEPEFDGGTLRAESTREGPDSEDTRPRLYDLDRRDQPSVDAQSMITEQIVRRVPLRDVVALAEEFSADRVQLTERNGALPSFAGNITRTIEYQGSYYDVSTEALQR